MGFQLARAPSVTMRRVMRLDLQAADRGYARIQQSLAYCGFVAEVAHDVDHPTIDAAR